MQKYPMEAGRFPMLSTHIRTQVTWQSGCVLIHTYHTLYQINFLTLHNQGPFPTSYYTQSWNHVPPAPSSFPSQTCARHKLNHVPEKTKLAHLCQRPLFLITPHTWWLWNTLARADHQLEGQLLKLSVFKRLHTPTIKWFFFKNYNCRKFSQII